MENIAWYPKAVFKEPDVFKLAEASAPLPRPVLLQKKHGKWYSVRVFSPEVAYRVNLQIAVIRILTVASYTW